MLMLLACGFTACRGDDRPSPAGSPQPIPRGGRSLGIDFGDLTQRGDYDDNRLKAESLKVATTTLALQWNSIEASPGVFCDPGSVLSLSNTYYPAYGIKLSLCIRAIDTVAVPVPADLAGTSFGSALLAERYSAMLDWVFTQIPAVDLASLNIGNEIDTNALSSPAFWAEYRSFFDAVAKHVRAHPTRGATRLGFIVTAEAAKGSFKAAILAAAANADQLGITYYPLNEDFSVQASASPEADFAAVLDAFGSKTLHFQEVGYPSGGLNGSSPEAQSRFFSAVFRAWDRHADQIPFLNIVRLVDYSPAAAESMAGSYGMGGDQKFTAYLETLGLRAWPGTGTDKAAIATLEALLAERGW